MRKLFYKKNNDMAAIGIGAMIVLIAMILVAGVAASVLVSTSNTLQSQAMKTGSQTTREVSSGLSVISVLGKVNASGSEGGDIEHLAITVAAKPGSDKIDLSNTYILISDGDEKALITYAGVDSSGNTNSSFYNDRVTGDIFEAMNWNGTNATSIDGNDSVSPGANKSNWSWTNEQFGIGVLQDYDGSMSITDPVLTRGDKAILYIRCDGDDTFNLWNISDGDYSATELTFTGVFGSQIGERVEIFGRIIPEVGAPGVISFTSPKAYVDTVYTLQ